MSKFDDDMARGCLPTGEPLECLYGVGWWTDHDEPEPDPYDLHIAELESRIAELEAAQKEALSLLPELERGHYYCEDCWYSCPKAVDGCCDESRGDECDCGADNYNAILAKIIGLLTSEVQK